MKNGKIWKGIATIVCAGCLVLTACTGSEIKARFTLNEQGELICTYPDGSEENLGRVTGENGADGRDGTDGKDGADGRDGLDGENGSDGKDGHNGVDGTDGVGIESTTTDENGNTVVTYTDGTVQVIEHRWDYVTTLRAATPWVAGADLYGCGDCGITKVVYEKYEDSHYTKGLKYMLNKDGESYTLMEMGSSNALDVVIPETYNGKPVTGIDLACELTKIEDSERSVTLPKSIIDVGILTGVKNIYVSEENENYTSIAGNLYSKDGKTLVKYATEKKEASFVIPESVTKIGERAFSWSYHLISITIGENVEEIEALAFLGCINLVEVYNLSKITDLTVRSNYSGHKIYNLFTSLNEESGVKIMENGFVFYKKNEKYALKGYTGSNTNLTLPDSFEGEDYEIDDFAFFWDYTITSVTIPENITKINNNAFQCCNNLKEIILGRRSIIIDRLTLSIQNLEIFYQGTEEEKNLNVENNSIHREYFTWYYYSEEKPTEEGNYWHYVDGEAVKW